MNEVMRKIGASSSCEVSAVPNTTNISNTLHAVEGSPDKDSALYGSIKIDKMKFNNPPKSEKKSNVSLDETSEERIKNTSESNLSLINF